MIDLKYLQKNFDEVSLGLGKKGVAPETIGRLKHYFGELKKANSAYELKKAEQNKLSKEFGIRKREGGDITTLKQQMDDLKKEVSNLLENARNIEEKLQNLAIEIPNIPDPSVPAGKDEEDNVVIKNVLAPPEFDFKPKEHWELAKLNNWIDFERGVKLAKSRFAVLRGEAAALHRALINYFLDKNTKAGFIEYAVPFLNNSQMLLGTGQLPKFEDDLFKVCEEDLYLIPTAEVPLTNLFHDEILECDELPLKMTAYSPCFRKEAGSAGRDTRGMIRQHQFAKVEMVAITRPEQSDNIFDLMVENASQILSELGLAHRLVELCGGDLGFSAAKTIDIEVWLPGQKKYREISSITNTRDFQARRARIRFKDKNGKNRLVHTLNGSALAVGRTIVAIMENYQKKDGTIEIPDILKNYLYS